MHIAIDLDGTLCEYAPGMCARGEIGKILPWAERVVPQLVKLGHHITVFTARPPEQHPLISHDLLGKLGISLNVTNVKDPSFDVILDDRALPRTGWASLKQIIGFKPWWQE